MSTAFGTYRKRKIECNSWEWLLHLDDLAFLERQLLISSIRVGWHWHGVVIKESHKHAGQFLWLRFVIVIQGSSSPPLPAPTVAIWKRGGFCCYYWPSTLMLAGDAVILKYSPSTHAPDFCLLEKSAVFPGFCFPFLLPNPNAKRVSCVRKALSAGFRHLNGETSMPESETEKGYLHKKMSVEIKLRRPQEVWTNSWILVKVEDLTHCTTAC